MVVGMCGREACTAGGMYMAKGGMHGGGIQVRHARQGVCMAKEGHVWQRVKGMHDEGVMHGKEGVCMAKGACMVKEVGRHVW